MNYIKLINKINKINQDFDIYLKNFKNDKIFKTKGNLYLKEDKKELHKKWKKFSGVFSKLKFIIASLSINIFFLKNPNNFIIKHYCINLYYKMCISLQETFKNDEDFIRQYLDDNFKENYSTIARYIYKPKFLFYINYPKEFLLYFENKIGNEIKPLLKTNFNNKIKLDFDYKNFYYYFKYKIDNLLGVLTKYFGKFALFISFKIHTIDKNLILEYKKIAKPGDIIISRESFAFTNISIPGFWKHMSMYIGNGNYLKTNFNINGLENNTEYIIESTNNGVKIISIYDFSKGKNYIGFFRTNFSKQKIHNAIKISTSYLNKEYDYLFNFYSDNSFVCSELITKAYLKENLDDEGLSIVLEKVAGKLTYPPNSLVKKANLEKNINNEIFPVFFIDMKNLKNFINSNENLLKSYKRNIFNFYK